jgi:hypothetical protein
MVRDMEGDSGRLWDQGPIASQRRGTETDDLADAEIDGRGPSVQGIEVNPRIAG